MLTGPPTDQPISR